MVKQFPTILASEEKASTMPLFLLCGVQKIYKWFSRDDGTLTYRLESETSQKPRDSWSTQRDEEK